MCALTQGNSDCDVNFSFLPEILQKNVHSLGKKLTGGFIDNENVCYLQLNSKGSSLYPLK